MTLAIMAAGMGSRYGGIKQIDPMGPNGEIILDYSVHDAVQSGFNRVVFIIRRDIEQVFRQSIGKRFSDRITVEYAFQELDKLLPGYTVPSGREKPWGTGQAILACKGIIDEPFIIINADDFYGTEAFQTGFKALQNLNTAALEAFLVAYKLSNTLSPHGHVTRGVCEVVGNRLVKVMERFKIQRNSAGTVEWFDGETAHFLSGNELVSMNFWGFTPGIFDAMETGFMQFLSEHGTELKSEFLLPDMVDSLVASGQMAVNALETQARWFGVTFPEDKPAVRGELQKLIERGVYDSPLW